MIIRVTGKLAKQVGINPMDSLPLADDPVSDWTCRVFELDERESLMLITNTASLYSFLTPANGLETAEQFGNGLGHYLERQLLADNFGNVFKKQIVPKIQEIILAKTLDRSVTGSMTDMIKLAKYDLIEEGFSLVETTARLNKTPFKAIDYDHPRDQFVKLAQ